MAESCKTASRVPVSVIVPAYNIGNYIGETLESIFAQTLQPEEVIVINDGSSDRSAEIARAAGALVYDQENRGLSAARNAGLARATAPWVAFLDGDDLWDPEKLARQFSATKLDPGSDFVFTDFWQFDENGILNASVVHEVHKPFRSIKRTRLADDVWRCEPDELCALLPRHCVMVPSTLMIRRDLLIAIGGCDESLRYSEDIDVELRILAKTSALYIDSPLVGYRKHSSAMSKNRLSMRKGDIAVAERVFANPSAYLGSTTRWFESEWSTILEKGGRMAVVYGEQELARRWLSQSMKARPRFSTAFWIAMSWLTSNPLCKIIMSELKEWWFELQARKSRVRQ